MKSLEPMAPIEMPTSQVGSTPASMAEERDTMTAEERHGLYRLRYNEKARKFGWKTYEQLMSELGRDC